MSKEVGVIVLGIATALSPFMGLPGEFRTVLLVLLGLCLTAIGFFLRSETLERGGYEKSSFFIDNRATQESNTEENEVSSEPIRVQ
jgi:hypothetical protein